MVDYEFERSAGIRAGDDGLLGQHGFQGDIAVILIQRRKEHSQAAGVEIAFLLFGHRPQPLHAVLKAIFVRQFRARPFETGFLGRPGKVYAHLGARLGQRL